MTTGRGGGKVWILFLLDNVSVLVLAPSSSEVPVVLLNQPNKAIEVQCTLIGTASGSREHSPELMKLKRVYDQSKDGPATSTSFGAYFSSFSGTADLVSRVAASSPFPKGGTKTLERDWSIRLIQSQMM